MWCASFFLQPEEMSQAASWFLLIMFIALCAVIMTVISQRSGPSEFFEESAPYEGGDTRPPPPPIEAEDPDLQALSPEEDPEMPTTPGADMDPMYTTTNMENSGENPLGEDAMDNSGIEPFIGEEYEAF